MDSPLPLLAVIAAVPTLYLALRIFQQPFAGLWLWVILLPVSKTLASLAGYPFGEGPEVLRKLTVSDPILLLTAVALAVRGSRAGALRERQPRRIIGLFVAFCVVAILSALLGDSGAEALIEVGTYFWLCVSVVIICQLVSTRIRLRQVLSALRWAGIVACVAGAIGTILIWHGNVDNVLVRGGRVTGFFEGPNQVQSLLFVVIPFLCATAFSRTSSVATRIVHGVLIVLAFVSVVASGSRAGVLWTALAIWLTLVLASPRAGALWTCVLVLAGIFAWHVFVEHREDMPFALRRALSFIDQDRFELRELSHGRADQLTTWQTVFVEHPILGVGLDQFRYNVPRMVLGGKAQEMHNSYLSVLAETGVVGGLVMFTLLGTALLRSIAFLRRALRARSAEEFAVARALLVAYLTLLLYGTVNHGLRQRYFWFVVALIMSVPHLYGRARAVRLRARVRSRALAYRT